jgi:hypothetical protein
MEAHNACDLVFFLPRKSEVCLSDEQGKPDVLRECNVVSWVGGLWVVLSWRFFRGVMFCGHPDTPNGRSVLVVQISLLAVRFLCSACPHLPVLFLTYAFLEVFFLVLVFRQARHRYLSCPLSPVQVLIAFSCGAQVPATPEVAPRHGSHLLPRRRLQQ